MKQRFSSLDVIAHELANSLITLRVGNVYDLSSKIFLIKFAKPGSKKQMIIDSGFRCHLTNYSRATAAEPTPFVKKLRKYLQTRRVTSVQQVGTDRIIEFQFSEGRYKLFLEFYAGGNIILTDTELNVLALLRIVAEGEAQEELRVGLKYSVENRQNAGGVPPLTKQRLKDALQKAAERGDDGLVAGKKSKKKPQDALRKALAVSITEYPPMLVDHAMRITSFDSALKPADVLQSDALLDHLLRSLEEARRVVQEITSAEAAKGYIIAKKDPNTGSETAQEEGTRKGLLYDDFHPFRPRQFEDDPNLTFLQFDGFNATVDEFFSSIEGQKLESRLHEREAAAKRKIEAARNDQAKRLGGLQEVQELNVRKAAAIEVNVERVQEAMDAVNGLIMQGMDWAEIGKLIEIEQKRRNPVAGIIRLPLKLEENSITLLLEEEEEPDSGNDSAYETDEDVSDSEDEETTEKTLDKQKAIERKLVIDIDLGISPWRNAREYYDQKRSAAEKESKTAQSSTKALKSQEAKIAQDLKKGLKQEKAVLRPVRNPLWFEKFVWFISSDGYLVLGGHDAMQNEMLYKKYLKKGDVYLHADIQGAASVVIRNNPKTPDAPIPPSTLSQAGTIAVASSTAWDSKAGMSAWWVNADQVSKAAPTGEFLPPGIFNVKGKKNFLPPAQLLLGFGIAFQISETSKARHIKHRVIDDEVVGGSTTDATPASGSVIGEAPGEIKQDSSDAEENQSDAEGEKEDSEGEDDDQHIAQSNPLQSSTDTRPENDEPPVQQMQDLQVDAQSEPPEQEIAEEDSDDEISGPAASQSSTPQPQTQKGAKGPAPAKRGKKGKAKKIATKYKDQDEEDRLAAQAFLGSAAGLEKAEAEAKAKAAREAELAFQKERRRAQHLRTQEETKKHEEQRRIMLEQGVEEEEDESERQVLMNLDAFVGTPLPGDEILEAIPVCAPWAAMGRYKYKAKLQPGAQKKGKATKEILGRWLADAQAKGKIDHEARDTERIWPREVELLKGWKETEIINTIPVGKVRVMMAGGSAAASSKGAQGKGGRGGKGSKKQR